jgi:N-acetylglucosaminyl-diphospho-decaprenol L-rhamnosyltransferase
VADPVVIAIVNTNARDLLELCLRSLQPEVEAGRAEAWVVDNASSDGSAAMVAADFPWARLHASDVNLGFPQAANLVADRTDGTWFATCNEDIEVLPGALETLLATAERHPEAAIVAPQLVLPDGSTQHTVYPFPSFWVTVAHNLGLQRLVKGLGERLCLEGYWDPDRPRDVPWAFAAFVLIRRAAFDAVGGFDREMWMYGDDLDLAWRLRRAGWTIRYEPTARVIHKGGAATLATFGDARTATRMGATYAWMLRRRGLLRTWATAGVSYATMVVQLGLFTVLAAIRPGRYARWRDRARWWMGIHRAGLRSRRTILEADERAAAMLRQSR